MRYDNAKRWMEAARASITRKQNIKNEPKMIDVDKNNVFR